LQSIAGDGINRTEKARDTLPEVRGMADHKELWQELYEAALLEANSKKMQPSLEAAKAAIDARLRELQMDHGGTREEQHALSDALTGLRVLEREISPRPACEADEGD
jgi:hypothetical protein